MRIRLALTFAALVLVAPARGADAAAVAVQKADATQWHPGPGAFPAGLEITVLHGDPAQPGPFAVRLRAPAGYRFPPHTHGGDEFVTLVSGDLSVGMGERFDESALQAMAPGDFIAIPADAPHFASSAAGAVLQVHAIGPLTITCLDHEPGK